MRCELRGRNAELEARPKPSRFSVPKSNLALTEHVIFSNHTSIANVSMTRMKDKSDTKNAMRLKLEEHSKCNDSFSTTHCLHSGHHSYLIIVQNIFNFSLAHPSQTSPTPECLLSLRPPFSSASISASLGPNPPHPSNSSAIFTAAFK